LLGMGFTRVEMFENGKRALDAMKKEVVDMVFMDIQVG
jgi:YesN/AraC family two-component response regulator